MKTNCFTDSGVRREDKNLWDSTKQSIYQGSVEKNIKEKYVTKPSCKHCYGRGFLGFNKGVPVLCRCAKLKTKKEDEN